jgi:hypothetical protein
MLARPDKPQYHSFRSGLTYQDARAWFWSNSENPDDWGHCSHRKVIRAMASVKRAMFDKAVEAWELACEEWDAQEALGEEIAASYRTEARLCRSRSKAGNTRLGSPRFPFHKPYTLTLSLQDLGHAHRHGTRTRNGQGISAPVPLCSAHMVT